MNQDPNDVNRGAFIAGAVATIVFAARGKVAIAATVTTEVNAPEIPASVAAAATKSDTWWEAYRTWNPAMQRFPGSFLAAILRDAENGHAPSLEYIKDSGHFHQVAYLLRMRANGEAVFPRSAAPFAPPLTTEQLAKATRIPSGDESLTHEILSTMRANIEFKK